MQTKSFYKNQWFTLVEMLIVIVIIWVLAAALIPRLTSVRERANDVARKADIQQLVTAIVAYQLDTNWQYPYLSGSENIGIPVQSISWQLITAWTDSVPSDPMPSNVFELGGSTITGSYRYLRLMRDGLPNESFILMAKTQTQWWSNWVVSGALGQINSGDDSQYLLPCKRVDKTGGSAVLITWWICLYTDASQLRYILVR